MSQVIALNAAPLNRRIAAFALLFVLYQAAEGVGDILLHSAWLQATIMIASLMAAWPIGRWLGYWGYDAYGLDLSRTSLRLVGVGLLLAGLTRLAALFWGLATGVYALGAPASPPFGLKGATMLLGALVSTFVPSLAEDIITRGFWLKAFAIRWSGLAFVLATSVVYVLNHIFRLSEGPIEWLRLFCFGLAYASAAWRWRSLWAALGLHWGWNLTNALLDQLTSITVIKVEASPWFSIGAHLVMTAIVLLWPRPPEGVKERPSPRVAATW